MTNPAIFKCVYLTVPGHRFSDRLKAYEEDKQFWFDVSEVSERDTVLGVELRIWKRTKAKSNLDADSVEGDVLRIAVKQIVPGKDDA